MNLPTARKILAILCRNRVVNNHIRSPIVRCRGTGRANYGPNRPTMFDALEPSKLESCNSVIQDLPTPEFDRGIEREYFQ